MQNQYPADTDRVYRVPRLWSNSEIRNFAELFSGDVVNVSGWRDEDKEGNHYRDYFVNASSYSITNFKSEARGFQGFENEVFLDLTKELPGELRGRFDLVFNHTVLEHIFDISTAFSNLCEMSRDAIMIVVPLLQQMHADYGDYWRFTPQTLEMLCRKNNMTMLYCSFNSDVNASVYLFCIAVKPETLMHWQKLIPHKTTHIDPVRSMNGFENYAGCHAIQNPVQSVKFGQRIIAKLRTIFRSKSKVQ